MSREKLFLVFIAFYSLTSCRQTAIIENPKPTRTPLPISSVTRSSAQPPDEPAPQHWPQPTSTAPTAFVSATTAAPATATVTPATPSPPGPASVRFSPNGRYAFPLAGDMDLMTWTHHHWDGSNAVDIEAARRLAVDSAEFQAFIKLPVVAVISGTVAIADNPYGGLALLLAGQDSFSYYYGHLSEQWVADGQFVGVGEKLGRVGNTGLNTQYIEPHLHFSISSHTANDWRWDPDVNAAEQFLTWFNLPYHDLVIAEYPLDRAAGWPVETEADITRAFDEALIVNPDHGSIDIQPIVGSGGPIPVYATLVGEVNVNRATVMGLRVQITNRPARTTVVYSFLVETVVADGDVVQRGDLVGFLDPEIGLNYMLFVNDVPTDPVPTLGRPPG